MKTAVVVGVFCCLAAALALAAQTATPEGMALIPAGKFWMGRAHANNLDSLDLVPRAKMDDRPANHVYLDTFYIDKYEVTTTDYSKFLEVTKTKAPWNWPQGKIPQGADRSPVNNVNWFEATAYCKWAGKRLPTEAEWEKAARGGLDRNHYAWGDADIDRSEKYIQAPQGAGRTTEELIPANLEGRDAAPVGSYKPNGYGLYDMIGNVRE